MRAIKAINWLKNNSLAAKPKMFWLMILARNNNAEKKMPLSEKFKILKYSLVIRCYISQKYKL